MEGLVNFCTDVLQDAMEDKDDEFDEETKRMIVEKYVCVGKFHEYFGAFRSKKWAAVRLHGTMLPVPWPVKP